MPAQPRSSPIAPAPSVPARGVAAAHVIPVARAPPPPPQVSHCARCKDFSVVSSDPAFGSLCWYCATFPEKPVAESAMRGRPSRYHTAHA